MKIIGISGKKGSGKDTIANILCQQYSGLSASVGFATALKWEVSKACNITMVELEKHKANFRLILQGWGTDFRRKLHGDDYWLKQMDIAIKIFREERVGLLFITDVRFKNEYDYLVDKGHRVIRVEKPSNVVDTHISETELDNQQFEILIQNNGTIKDLEKKLLTLNIV